MKIETISVLKYRSMESGLTAIPETIHVIEASVLNHQTRSWFSLYFDRQKLEARLRNSRTNSNVLRIISLTRYFVLNLYLFIFGGALQNCECI